MGIFFKWIIASNTSELCAICDLGEEAGSVVQRDEKAQPLQEVVDRIQQSVNDRNNGIKHMLTTLTCVLDEAIASKCKAGTTRCTDRVLFVFHGGNFFNFVFYVR